MLSNETKTRIYLLAVGLVAILSSGSALAGAGEHVQMGQGELIPSVTARTHWSSNIYHQEGTVEHPEIAGLALLVKPALKLNIDGSDLRLDLEADYGIRQYLKSNQQNLSSYGETALAAGVVLFPRSKISVKVGADHSRKTVATEKPGTDDSLITVIHNRGSGAIALNPGSALTLNLGGFGSYDDYRVPAGATATANEQLNNRLGYGPEGSLKWTFFPRTAVLASYSQTWYTWQENQLNAAGDGSFSDDVGEYLAMPNSTNWRAQVGLHGRITERLVLSASGGYGRAIYDESSVGEEAQGDDPGAFAVDLTGFPEALIVRTGVQWSPRRGHTMDVGYWKDYQDSWFTNFVQYHYVFLRYDGMLTSRALMGVEGGYRLETYRGEVTRGDHVVRTEGYFTYRTSGWADVSLRGLWTRRASANEDLGLGTNQVWIEYDEYGGMFDITLRY